jgi:hypothetical protein
MNEIAFEKYKQVVYLLLLDFQFVEELLKIVTASSYEIIRRSVPAYIRFRPSRRDLEKESLGKLIRKYEEVSGNDSLARKLQALVSERNFCAHRSFVLTFEEQQDLAFLELEAVRLATLRERSRECVLELQEEWRRLAKELHESDRMTAEREAPNSVIEPSAEV